MTKQSLFLIGAVNLLKYGVLISYFVEKSVVEDIYTIGF